MIIVCSPSDFEFPVTVDQAYRLQKLFTSIDAKSKLEAEKFLGFSKKTQFKACAKDLSYRAACWTSMSVSAWLVTERCKDLIQSNGGILNIHCILRSRAEIKDAENHFSKVHSQWKTIQ